MANPEVLAQEMYLSSRLQAAASGGEAQNTAHSHFRLRQAFTWRSRHICMRTLRSLRTWAVLPSFRHVHALQLLGVVLRLCREGGASTSAALARPAANAEAAAHLASAAAVHAAAASAPSPTRTEAAPSSSHRQSPNAASHSIGVCALHGI